MKINVQSAVLFFAIAKGALAAESDDLAWQRSPLPGGIPGLARAAGLDPNTEPWRVLYETSRRLHPTYGDPADAARLRQRVQARLRASTTCPGCSVNLPLPRHLWNRAVLDQPATEDRLVEALLGDRNASLVYRGLFQVDEPTLRFLQGHPDLLSWIRNHAAEAFSVFAGSLHVRDGRVAVPGGAGAGPLWEEVVGEAPARAEPFVKKVLAHGDGHTAFFFYVVEHLAPDAQRFALGGPGADAKAKRERFRRLAATFAQGPAWWRPEGGAFARPLVDPAVVLGLVRVEADGRPAPPASRALWETAFAGDVPTRANGIGHGPAVDAAWLAENVGNAPTRETRRERLTQVAFAQRTLGEIAPGEVQEALLALRGLARYPALVLVLDRMGLRKPSPYAQAVRRADEIASIGASRGATTALAQFQGAVALLDRACFTGTLEATEAESLVTSLAAVPLMGGGYQGGIARWIEEHLLPALAPLVETDPASAEETVLGALAGDRPGGPAAPPFEWEGLWYRALPGVGERRRLRTIRERQGGNALDAVVGFVRVVRRFQGSPSPESLARVREAAQPLDTTSLSPDDQRILKSLQSASAPRAHLLVQAADQLLAETLVSLAYAPHLRSAQGTALAGANVATRHDFAGRAWELPGEVLGTGEPWHVRGSILGLDWALARLSLRRLTADMPAHSPGLDPSVALAFARTVASRSPVALRDDEARAISVAIGRGRKQAASAASGQEANTLARNAGLDAWRARGLRFVMEEERVSVDGFFTLDELLRLGQPVPVPGAAWGTPDFAEGGSLRPRLPTLGGHGDLVGQRQEDLHAARLPDLVLRVAVELDARHLPAALLPGVMSLFVQDFVQEAVPNAHDDWLALARYARDAPAERFDEYVSALAGEGPLVPAIDPNEGAQP